MIDPRGNSGLTDNKRLRQEGLGCLWSVVSEDISYSLNIWEVSQSLIPATFPPEAVSQILYTVGD